MLGVTKISVLTGSTAVLLGSLFLMTATPVLADLAAEGKKIAEDRKKGNCASCHQYEGANLAGNAGPPLVAMKARFPDKQQLFDQIWDPTKRNPGTMMPPFGRHEILSKKDIEAIAEWVWTL